VGNSHPLNLSKSGVHIVVIDPGHGGKDPGSVASGNRGYEKDLALSISKKLGNLITKSMKDVKVIYTRETDEFIPLWQRASIANKNQADLFISVHCNSNESKTPHGTETYVMGLHKTAENLNVSKRENGSILLEDDYESNGEYSGFDPNSDEAHIILSLYQNAYRAQSLVLAGEFQEQIESKQIRKNLGVKEAGFLVLWKTSMPSILVETGFISNSDDLEFLKSEPGKDAIAKSIYKALENYKTGLESKK
jgi:N-acetylmuramoyl-L-alanine amidase